MSHDLEGIADVPRYDAFAAGQYRPFSLVHHCCLKQATVSLTREIELATQMRVKVESVTAYVYKFLKRDSGIVRPPFCVAVIGLQAKTRGSFTLWLFKNWAESQ